MWCVCMVCMFCVVCVCMCVCSLYVCIICVVWGLCVLFVYSVYALYGVFVVCGGECCVWVSFKWVVVFCVQGSCVCVVFMCMSRGVFMWCVCMVCMFSVVHMWLWNDVFGRVVYVVWCFVCVCIYVCDVVCLVYVCVWYVYRVTAGIFPGGKSQCL